MPECILEPANKTAKDLGKPQPKVDLQTNDILIPREVEDVIRHTMIHLLRNALDHGIEPPSERLSKGKAEAGAIIIHSSSVEQMIQISVSDDGRGLDMKQLRAKGFAKGLITERSCPEEIARLIFVAGLSTAHSLSQISGHGVGMDAVRRFIEDCGGSIDVILHASEGEMIPFTLELKLPLAAAEPKAHEDQLTTEGILGWLPGSFPFNSHRDKKQNSDGLV